MQIPIPIDCRTKFKRFANKESATSSQLQKVGAMSPRIQFYSSSFVSHFSRLVCG